MIDDIWDIHCHILPGVDDGSQDLTDSILMAELAVEGGTDIIVATAHSHVPWSKPENHIIIVNVRNAVLRSSTQRGTSSNWSINAKRSLPKKVKINVKVYRSHRRKTYDELWLDGNDNNISSLERY